VNRVRKVPGSPGIRISTIPMVVLGGFGQLKPENFIGRATRPRIAAEVAPTFMPQAAVCRATIESI